MNNQVKDILEASLFAASEPLSIVELQNLFLLEDRPDKHRVRDCMLQLEKEYAEKPIELVEVAGGYRFQVRTKYATWVSRLWEEKPVKYGRALLETLAIVAYQQPATRGDIEDIRGVAVSTNTIRTLTEREWIRVVGHKDVPGKPALYATTAIFLDYFNLQTLADLPPLAKLMDIDPREAGDSQIELGEAAPLEKTYEESDTTRTLP
ncbi:MAG: SMC-Scp complex subunit ScpB [Piscirickettsiaceae bacterium]|nr:MAG: SMC-Scp complex subunit ScpB [Piscirickettsiaceae bacterium]PCI66919.1 MAG: SMC-Scp complex subunit ScpB [Piscirickettsiaceae bacterium]